MVTLSENKRTITDRINDRDEIKRPKHQTKNSKPV